MEAVRSGARAKAKKQRRIWRALQQPATAAAAAAAAAAGEKEQVRKSYIYSSIRLESDRCLVGVTNSAHSHVCGGMASTMGRAVVAWRSADGRATNGHGKRRRK